MEYDILNRLGFHKVNFKRTISRENNGSEIVGFVKWESLEQFLWR